MKSIYWIRNDLRLADNPALVAAVRSGETIPIYIHDPKTTYKWRAGAASKVWLHHSLKALELSYENKGGKLFFRKGDPLKLFPELVRSEDIQAVYWNKSYEPESQRIENELEKILSEMGVRVRSYSSYLFFEPGTVLTKQQTPYKVFTPFYNTALKQLEAKPPLPPPVKIDTPETIHGAVQLDELELLPSYLWWKKLVDHWNFGENAAGKMLDEFLDAKIIRYSTERDFLASHTTSKLSPYLHHGEISPNQLLWTIQQQANSGVSVEARNSSDAFIRQLIWREFAYSLLFYHPQTPDEPLHAQFSSFPWQDNDSLFVKWKNGETGYPVVDTAMRELWETGSMHNRARMIVASFLTKDLLIPWQRGAEWFWDTLFDADLANNTFGWQWTAGCGADASPYYRIFNPETQSRKFDNLAEYLKKWLPELRKLDHKAIHAPWKISSSQLENAGIKLGKEYPYPIVDHSQAREKALQLYQLWKFGLSSAD
ncbi:DNA photolyase family protein [bacterium]|nr:DNA photolyase family protein [bacterium]